MFVEQAIFTSVRSGRNEGYQIAAASPGVTLADKQELSQWGPGHDALYDARPTAESVNCHRMASGTYCLSRTLCAGREYSGRGGHRVYTHCFLLPDDLLLRFSHHPFRVMEALVVSGRAAVLKPIPDQLPPALLVGRAHQVKTVEIERLCHALGPEKLAAALGAALGTELLGIAAPVSMTRLLSVLLDLLPLPYRRDFSWTTGLRVSPRRPYRVAGLPADRDGQRQAVRLMHLTVLDLHDDPPARFAARTGWPLLVFDLLRSRRWPLLQEIVREASQCPQTDIDLLAERYRERIASEPDVELLTPFLPTACETAGTGSGCRVDQPTLPGDTGR